MSGQYVVWLCLFVRGAGDERWVFVTDPVIDQLITALGY